MDKWSYWANTRLENSLLYRSYSNLMGLSRFGFAGTLARLRKDGWAWNSRISDLPNTMDSHAISEVAKEEKERKEKENPLDSQGWYSVGPKIRHPFIPLKSCGLRVDWGCGQKSFRGSHIIWKYVCEGGVRQRGSWDRAVCGGTTAWIKWAQEKAWGGRKSWRNKSQSAQWWNLININNLCVWDVFWLERKEMCHEGRVKNSTGLSLLETRQGQD